MRLTGPNLPDIPALSILASVDIDDESELVKRDVSISVRSFDEKKRTCTFIASTPAVDAYEEIVEQDWILDHFRSNPVILYGHQSRDLPIGKGIHCEVVSDIQGTHLEIEVQFAEAKHNPLAENVFQCVKDEFLRAGSVGFRPRSVRYEKRNGKDVYVLSQNVLKEFSIVTIPANHEALAKGAPDPIAKLKARAKALAKSSDETSHRMPMNEPTGKPLYSVGDVVTATAEHMPGMKGSSGKIAIVREAPAYYGVQFDGAKEVHRWLAEDELVVAAKAMTSSQKEHLAPIRIDAQLPPEIASIPRDVSEALETTARGAANHITTAGENAGGQEKDMDPIKMKADIDAANAKTLDLQAKLDAMTAEKAALEARATSAEKDLAQAQEQLKFWYELDKEVTEALKGADAPTEVDVAEPKPGEPTKKGLTVAQRITAVAEQRDKAHDMITERDVDALIPSKLDPAQKADYVALAKKDRPLFESIVKGLPERKILGQVVPPAKVERAAPAASDNGGEFAELLGDGETKSDGEPTELSDLLDG